MAAPDRLGNLTPRSFASVLGPNSTRHGIYDPLNRDPTTVRRRVAHWFAFATLSFLLALLGRTRARRLMGLATALSFGGLIEGFQHLLTAYPLEVWDIRNDSCASVGGLVLATLTVRALPKWSRP